MDEMIVSSSSGVTVVGHDSEGRLRVAPCEEAGCYSRHIIYNQASIDQLRALTEVSESCEQFVRVSISIDYHIVTKYVFFSFAFILCFTGISCVF